jgi:hypothetical protein
MKTIIQLIIRRLKKIIYLASPEGELVMYGNKKNSGTPEDKKAANKK